MWQANQQDISMIYLAMASSSLLFSLLVFFSSALLFFFLIIIRQRRAKEKSTNLPPSPRKLPIIGNLHQFGFFPHRSLRLLSNKHGPLMLLYQCHIPTLVVSSAEIAEEIMKTHDLVFANRPLSHAGNLMLYGCKDILFSPYGDYWKQLRKLCMLQLLSAKRVRSFHFLIEEEVGTMIEFIISRCYLTSPAVDLSHVLHSLVNGIMSRMALGKKYGGESEREVDEMTEKMWELLGAVSVGDYFPRLAWMDVVTGLDGRLKKVARSVNAFLDRVIEDHEMDGGDREEAGDFVDVLLHLEKDSRPGTQFSRDSVKSLILDMFVATKFTAMTLEWAMAELIKHPNVIAKAQEEARRVLGRKPKVEVEDLHQMHFIKCIIKETLRLHPPGPLLGPRESSTKAKIQGYNIPPKTRVIINAWAIARDPTLWERSEKFVPERFVDNPVDFKGNDFHFTPFGSGRRTCPGISLASHTMELVLTNLLCFFDWELPHGGNVEDLDMSEIGVIIAAKRVPLHLIPIHHVSSYN